MQRLRTVLAQKLRDLLQLAVEQQKDALAYGAAIQSYEQYRERVGHIQGLKVAIELCDEAEKAADAQERGV